MLTREQLLQLHQDWGQSKVLSVYLEGGAHDFAERGVWRKRFERALAERRKAIDAAGGNDTSDFDAAAANIGSELASFDQFLPGLGWVGFATGEKLVYGEAVPVPMPDLVRWDEGPRIAPYVRALKQERLVVVALVDSRRGRIFEYREGDLREVEDLLAGPVVEDFASINVSKRATGYTGVRGKTGTDAAQWSEQNEAERLMKKLGAALGDRVGSEGLLVVGGVPEAIAWTVQSLPTGVRDRTVERPSGRVEMSEAEVRDLAVEAASDLHRGVQRKLLDETLDLARSGGKGALGPRDVEQALEEARVETLLLSRGFIGSDPDYADRLVASALEQGAEVEELSMDGAERLDTEARGVAARLRYVLRS